MYLIENSNVYIVFELFGLICFYRKNWVIMFSESSCIYYAICRRQRWFQVKLASVRHTKLGHTETAMTSFTGVSMVTGNGMTSRLTQLPGPGQSEAFINRGLYIYIFRYTTYTLYSYTNLLTYFSSPKPSWNTRAKLLTDCIYVANPLIICF